MNKKTNKKYILNIMQGLSYLTQLGLSIISPILLSIYLAYLVTKHFNMGTWVYVVALVLGLGGAVSSFLGFAKYMQNQSKKADIENKTSFNK